MASSSSGSGRSGRMRTATVTGKSRSRGPSRSRSRRRSRRPAARPCSNRANPSPQAPARSRTCFSTASGWSPQSLTVGALVARRLPDPTDEPNHPAPRGNWCGGDRRRRARGPVRLGPGNRVVQPLGRPGDGARRRGDQHHPDLAGLTPRGRNVVGRSVGPGPGCQARRGHGSLLRRLRGIRGRGRRPALQPVRRQLVRRVASREHHLGVGRQAGNPVHGAHHHRGVHRGRPLTHRGFRRLRVDGLLGAVPPVPGLSGGAARG